MITGSLHPQKSSLFWNALISYIPTFIHKIRSPTSDNNDDLVKSAASLFEIILNAAGIYKGMTPAGKALLPFIQLHSFSVNLICDPLTSLSQHGGNILIALLEMSKAGSAFETETALILHASFVNNTSASMSGALQLFQSKGLEEKNKDRPNESYLNFFITMASLASCWNDLKNPEVKISHNFT